MQMQWNLWKFYDMTHAVFVSQWMWVASNFGDIFLKRHETLEIDFSIKPKNHLKRESATSQKLILWKASATTACGFIKFSALLCVDITLPHTASHLTHIRCKWSVFCKTCTIFTFYAPNKTWNYFFQSNKDERGLLLKGS